MNFERIKKNVSRYYHYILTLEISGKSIWPSLRNSPDKKGEENKKKEKNHYNHFMVFLETEDLYTHRVNHYI